jgi:hypothetical protein
MWYVEIIGILVEIKLASNSSKTGLIKKVGKCILETAS